MNDESRKQEIKLKRKRLRRLQDILRHINRIYESEKADGQNRIIQQLNDLVAMFSTENHE